MPIEVIKGNVLEADAQAVVLTVDGAHEGMEGNIARAFARANPDTWEELAQDFDYPIPLGSARLYTIDRDLGCRNRFCILAATPHHREVLETGQKKTVVASALRAALTLASRRGVECLATVVLAGGWRLTQEDALGEMIRTYKQFANTTHRAPVLQIFVLGDSEFGEIKAHLARDFSDSIKKDGKYLL